MDVVWIVDDVVGSECVELIAVDGECKRCAGWRYLRQLPLERITDKLSPV